MRVIIIQLWIVELSTRVTVVGLEKRVSKFQEKCPKNKEKAEFKIKDGFCWS